MDRDTLIKYENKLAKLFVNSRKQNRLANAYLLYGNRNAPLKEVAFYLAQSLSCERDYLACNECPSCKRFINGVRPDFFYIDGDDSTIKKDDVKELEKSFSMSALEKNHRLTYVINKLENITEEAINALLKFLEEPKEGQIAFLTTNNITKVLPTIISRCLLVRIDPIDSDKFYQSLLDLNFKNAKKTFKLNPSQAYLLSKLYGSREEVEAVINEGSFLKAYDVAEAFLNDLTSSIKEGGYTLLKEMSKLDDSKCYNYLYLLIDLVFQMSITGDLSDDNPLSDIASSLSKYKRLECAEKILKQAIALKQVNLNPTLVGASLIKSLEEEDKR